MTPQVRGAPHSSPLPPGRWGHSPVLGELLSRLSPLPPTLAPSPLTLVSVHVGRNGVGESEMLCGLPPGPLLLGSGHSRWRAVLTPWSLSFPSAIPEPRAPLCGGGGGRS